MIRDELDATNNTVNVKLSVSPDQVRFTSLDKDVAIGFRRPMSEVLRVDHLNSAWVAITFSPEEIDEEDAEFFLDGLEDEDRGNIVQIFSVPEASAALRLVEALGGRRRSSAISP